jgi:probable NAD-dependent malic enzyme 4
MHDDQHGTAIVTLAGIINACKVTNRQISSLKVVINGVGAAGTAIAKLLLNYGVKDIVMVDSKGAIYEGRDGLNPEKEMVAKITNSDKISGKLEDVIVGRDVFIGVSVAGALTGEMVKKMAPNPIIFAMANPIPEIMPEVAKEAGAQIIGTGRSDYPNQVNNVLAFPGIFKGVLKYGKKQITEDMKIKAAEAIAGYIKNPSVDEILPNPLDKGVADVVAEAMK